MLTVFTSTGASHVHGDFFSAFATGGTPAGGLVPVHGIVRRIAGFFTGGSGESHGFSRFRLRTAIRHFPETGEFPVPIQALRFGCIQRRRHEAGDAERSNAEGRACNIGEHICDITTGNLPSCKIFIQQDTVSARITSAGFHASGGMTCGRVQLCMKASSGDMGERKMPPAGEGERTERLAERKTEGMKERTPDRPC